MLSIQTFGSLEVRSGGQPIGLPPSRKTRALLAYLLLSPAPQRRDRLWGLLWRVPDAPRAALRWSLSKLRPILSADGCSRLVSDRESVRIKLEHIRVDFHELRACASDEGSSPDVLARAWELSREPLMSDCDLPDHADFMAWLEHQRSEGTRFRAQLARRLALTPNLSADEAERWAHRWLLDAPRDVHAAQQLVGAMRRAGRAGDAAELAVELERRFRQAGLTRGFSDVGASPVFRSAGAVEGQGAAHSRVEREAQLQEPIRFVPVSDGTTLAWASVGTSPGLPLVNAANWLTHMKLDWDGPVWSPLFRNLARTHRFVRYDPRGSGLSDWDVPRINFETFVSDLEMVVDAAALQRFALLGIGQGAATSIEYAVRHPERVSRLILFGGYAAGWRYTASPDALREQESLKVLTDAGWSRNDPAYRNILSRTVLPGASEEELRWFDELQRRATSPVNAARFLEAISRIDVRDRLRHVTVPTLVIHSRRDLRVPFSMGCDLARQIPRAEFLGLDSDNHFLLGREPASLDFIQAVRDFIDGS